MFYMGDSPLRGDSPYGLTPMFEFRSGGRRVSSDEFFENLKREAIEGAMKELEQRIHAAAASIIDPETGKHAEVFVRRTGETQLALRTRGSPAFARELEKRVGIETGSIETMSTLPANNVPRVYLAHASEDHATLAKPLAERLIASGVDVWLDEWEIRAGDSLRRKMEEGLSTCTHFVVILTPNSLHKPWVETEIDAGFVRAVGGESRFIGLRAGISVTDLSPFLQTLRCPEIRLDQASEVEGLIADIHGVSRKPERGAAPRYVKTVPEGLKGWSPAAAAVAEHLVRASELGRKFDPQVTIASVAEATGLPEEDIRIGVLDLTDSGLVERSKGLGSDFFWPTISLFVEFDRHFLDFNSEQDAVTIANRLVSQKIEFIGIDDLAALFSDWTPRRLNSALNYLDDAKLIQPLKALDSGPWTMKCLRVTDQTRRFVRDHG
jgi:TIR domain-containing protein